MESNRLKTGQNALWRDRLADSPDDKKQQVLTVGKAYQSVMGEEWTYISSAITSGKRLYDVAAAEATTPDELRKDKAKFFKMVIEPNIQEAIAFAQEWSESHSGATISPAVFEAGKLRWTQDEYMAMWLDTIHNKATRIVMMDGWEYSNGGVLEFVQAFLMKTGLTEKSEIEILKQDGSPLTLKEAAERITEAAYYVQRYDAPLTQLEALHKIDFTTAHFQLKDDVEIPEYLKSFKMPADAQILLYERGDELQIKDIKPFTTTSPLSKLNMGVLAEERMQEARRTASMLGAEAVSLS